MSESRTAILAVAAYICFWRISVLTSSTTVVFCVFLMFLREFPICSIAGGSGVWEAPLWLTSISSVNRPWSFCGITVCALKLSVVEVLMKCVDVAIYGTNVVTDERFWTTEEGAVWLDDTEEIPMKPDWLKVVVIVVELGTELALCLGIAPFLKKSVGTCEDNGG